MKISLFFVAQFGAVISEIVVVPSNTVVMAGKDMSMNCITANHSTVRKWSFHNSALAIPSIFTKHGSSGRFHEHFRHFGAIINAVGPVTIFTNSTRPSDAGNYTCHCEIDGKDAEYSAHLIVLESLPVCESNLSRNNSHSLIHGDFIWIQCSIDFSGFWAPSMEWNQHGGDFGPYGKNVTEGIEMMLNSSHSVTSKLIIAVNSSTNGSYYSCKVYFAKYSDIKITTAVADNIPDFMYIWNSSLIYASQSSTQSVSRANGTETSLAVTSSIRPTTEKSSSVDWYFVSLSLVGGMSLFFILMVVLVVALCFRFKRKVSSHYAPATKEAIEMPTQESDYDMIPYATSDNYETIIDEEDTDPSVELSPQSHVGVLPTPGYSCLLPVQPCPPAIYSRMESYETPADIVPYSNLTKVKVEIIPEKPVGELGSRKTESPPKESLLNAPTYLEVKV